MAPERQFCGRIFEPSGVDLVNQSGRSPALAVVRPCAEGIELILRQGTMHGQQALYCDGWQVGSQEVSSLRGRDPIAFFHVLRVAVPNSPLSGGAQVGLRP